MCLDIYAYRICVNIMTRKIVFNKLQWIDNTSCGQIYFSWRLLCPNWASRETVWTIMSVSLSSIFAEIKKRLSEIKNAMLSIKISRIITMSAGVAYIVIIPTLTHPWQANKNNYDGIETYGCLKRYWRIYIHASLKKTYYKTVDNSWNILKFLLSEVLSYEYFSIFNPLICY